MPSSVPPPPSPLPLPPPSRRQQWPLIGWFGSRLGGPGGFLGVGFAGCCSPFGWAGLGWARRLPPTKRNQQPAIARSHSPCLGLSLVPRQPFSSPPRNLNRQSPSPPPALCITASIVNLSPNGNHNDFCLQNNRQDGKSATLTHIAYLFSFLARRDVSIRSSCFNYLLRRICRRSLCYRRCHPRLAAPSALFVTAIFAETVSSKPRLFATV